jgi:membrane-associated protease RseP (regulator of RpoE activity)
VSPAAVLLAASLLVAAGAAAQEAPPRARPEGRVVVAGDEGRIVLERVRDGEPAVRLGPAFGAPRGPVVLLDQLGLGRGYLGVQLIGLTEQLRARFGVPPGEGALVSDVVAGSPAELAGVRAGDVITGVDGRPVQRTGDVGVLVAGRHGETVDLEVFRDGTPIHLGATVAERRRPLVKIGRRGDAVRLEWIGGGEPRRLDAAGARSLVDDALQGLGLYFESDEWRERAAGPEATDGRAELDAEQIQRRIEALKRQIIELREQLEAGDPDSR